MPSCFILLDLVSLIVPGGRLQWLSALRQGLSLAGIAGSNSAGSKDVCCEWCVLSGSGLCDGPIPRPEESYQL